MERYYRKVVQFLKDRLMDKEMFSKRKTDKWGEITKNDTVHERRSLRTKMFCSVKGR